ncbi:family 16 glycosylhydrolase [Ramlibacter sp. AN1015]|uniref:family 16 glycosylhydrolase n=1 Tax=Ramlibacter sp. AN1015 TaxID=3133428 RepID=UPI0030BD80C6
MDAIRMQGVALGLAAVLLASCGGGGGEPRQAELIEPRALASTPAFEDTMLTNDTARWIAADWNNGGYFLNGWHPDQLAFEGGQLKITLAPDTRGLTGLSCVSGEYRTRDSYGWGTFTSRLKASGVPGSITSFFLYTGPAEGTRHDEIDVEIKGDDPTRVHLNYWSDGREHPTVVDLGFDASAGFHDYAFRWTPQSLQWFVDGRLVHEERGARGPLPEVPGKIMLSLWGATGAEPWSTNHQAANTASAWFDRVSVTPLGAEAERIVSVAALSGSAAPQGRGWRATVHVHVRDATGAAVAGAQVSGTFSTGGAVSPCTTDATGSCALHSGVISKGKSSTTFTVGAIVGAQLHYHAPANAMGSLVIGRP